MAIRHVSSCHLNTGILFLYLSLLSIYSLLFFIRFNTHKEQTMPIIKHYEKLNLVKTIHATGTPDEV